MGKPGGPVGQRSSPQDPPEGDPCTALVVTQGGGWRGVRKAKQSLHGAKRMWQAYTWPKGGSGLRVHVKPGGSSRHAQCLREGRVCPVPPVYARRLRQGGIRLAVPEARAQLMGRWPGVGAAARLQAVASGCCLFSSMLHVGVPTLCACSPRNVRTRAHRLGCCGKYTCAHARTCPFGCCAAACW